MLKVALSGKVRGSLVNHVTSFLNLATTRITRRYESRGVTKPPALSSREAAIKAGWVVCEGGWEGRL